MSAKVDVDIRVRGAKKAKKEIDDVADGTKDLAEGTSTLTDALDDLTGGAVSAFQKFKGGITSVVKGMMTLKGAIISTGIGALVLAVGSLVSYFTQTQRGAEMFEKISAVLGTTIGVLTDKVSLLGEYLIGAFKNPKEALDTFWQTIKTYVLEQVNALLSGFGKLGDAIGLLFKGEFGAAADTAKEGAKQIGEAFLRLNPATAGVMLLTDAVKEMAPEIDKAARAAARLAERSIALRKAQRDLAVDFARGRAEIQEYNLVAEDTTRTLEERMDAATKAIELEQSLLNRRIALAAEEVSIQKQKMALTESTEQDYEKLAELEVNLLNMREESAGKQTELQNKLNAMRTEAAAAIQEQIDAERELFEAEEERRKQLEAALQTEEQNEIDAVVEKYETLFALADEFGQGHAELIEKQRAELFAIHQKYNKKEVEDTELTEEEKAELRRNNAQQALSTAQQLLGVLMSLNESNDTKDVERQRKLFKRNKAMQMAGAAMSTAQAVIAALAPPPTGLGNPWGTVNAIAAGLAGAAQIGIIAKQQFPGGGGDVPAPAAGAPIPTLSTVPTNMAPGGFSPAAQIEAQPLVRAFVVSSEVTTQQQLDATLAHQTTL
jgi:hypothetical protein